MDYKEAKTTFESGEDETRPLDQAVRESREGNGRSMSPSVTVQRRAPKQIARYPTNMRDRVDAPYRPLQAILVPQEPTAPGRGRLVSTRGDYRVPLEKDGEERAVTILQVGHRRDVYR